MPRIIQRETAACIGAGADPTLWELRRVASHVLLDD